MSAAVVSTSVMGSAATMIHLGGGSARASARTCSRNVRALAKNSGASNRKMTQSGSCSASRVAAHVVVPGHAADPAQDRLVRPPGPAEDVADREGDGDPDPGEHAEQRRRRGTPRSTARTRSGAAVEPHRRRQVGQRERRGDDDRGKRRLGQVAQQPRGEQERSA